MLMSRKKENILFPLSSLKKYISAFSLEHHILFNLKKKMKNSEYKNKRENKNTMFTKLLF